MPPGRKKLWVQFTPLHQIHKEKQLTKHTNLPSGLQNGPVLKIRSDGPAHENEVVIHFYFKMFTFQIVIDNFFWLHFKVFSFSNNLFCYCVSSEIHS